MFTVNSLFDLLEGSEGRDEAGHDVLGAALTGLGYVSSNGNRDGS